MRFSKRPVRWLAVLVSSCASVVAFPAGPGPGGAGIHLIDWVEVPAEYGAGSLGESLASGAATPSALVSADLDEDGVADLVCGYVMARGGALAIHFRSIPGGREREREPFQLPVRLVETQFPPDFLGAGDFDADGHVDIVAAARGDHSIHLFPGDGRGGVRPSRRIHLAGRVTALAAGEINRADGLADLAVGIEGRDGPAALLFESPQGALEGEPESIALPEEAVAFAFGLLDEEYPHDLVVAAGSHLVLVHGRDRLLSVSGDAAGDVGPPRVDTNVFPGGAILSVAAGRFLPDATSQNEVALLTADGNVHVMSFGREPMSEDVLKLSLPAAESSERKQASPGYRLFPARLSGGTGESLLALDPPGRRVHVLVPGLAPPALTLDLRNEPAALLPMQLNEDALSDLVLLTRGGRGPAVSLTAPRSTFTVNSTGNTSDAAPGNGICEDAPASGTCTLRAAIQEANASAGPDTIVFGLGAGFPTIGVAPALPTITGPVTIDGATGGATRIELNGVAAGAEAPALSLGSQSDGSTIRSLVVNRFSGPGILIQSGDNKVEDCYIGPDASGGSSVAGNGQEGIRITSRTAFGNAIGGPGSARNVISHNVREGVRLDNGPFNNHIRGNLIGTAANGTTANPNSVGVRIDTNFFGPVLTSNNVIGGTPATLGNVVSGNLTQGVDLLGALIFSNLVQGNTIGTNAAGTAALANGADGVRVAAASNTVGGTTAALGNLISGNGGHGVVITGSSNSFNVVRGNRIGTDVTGSVDLGNAGLGVRISSSRSNTVGGETPTLGTAPGNLISGNNGGGVRIENANTNLVQGNLVGTSAGGIGPLGNGGDGVGIAGGSSNTIGGSSGMARNVIAASASDGVEIDGAAGTIVAGNLIGTDVNGAAALPNVGNGVLITATTPTPTNNNTIGGSADGPPGAPPGNVISGNGADGVLINTAGAISNFVSGNLIGTNASGTAGLRNGGNGVAIVNGESNRIGGPSFQTRNVISGNNQGVLADGVEIRGTSARFNKVEGNFIGTDVQGNTPLPNGGNGVLVQQGAADNTIGGVAGYPGLPRGNVISGHSLDPGSDGVEINGAGTTGNLVQGNLIGPGATGLTALGNRNNGVLITSGASGNVVGGSSVFYRNVISGNDAGSGDDGVEINQASNNTVRYNFIGLDMGGSSPLPNGGEGILITDGGGAIAASGNTIGGQMQSEPNVISGNVGSGVRISGALATANTVSGNFIGTDGGGAAGAGNGGSGVLITSGASNNLVGGASNPGACTSGPCNVIVSNAGAGVRVDSAASTGNAIRASSIFLNLGLGIDLGPPLVTPNDPGDSDAGANALQNFPEITSAEFDGANTNVTGAVHSLSSTTFTIDVFANSAPDPSGYGQGQTYLGTTTSLTNGTGDGTFALQVSGEHRFITATATHPSGSTSELSAFFSNPGEARDLLGDKGAGTSVDIAYTPACGAADHAAYLGTTPISGAPSWIASFCGLGTGGTATFDPGSPSLGESFYFVVVGQSATVEGSYGRHTSGAERPEGTTGACDLPQELTVTCP